MAIQEQLAARLRMPPLDCFGAMPFAMTEAVKTIAWICYHNGGTETIFFISQLWVREKLAIARRAIR